MSRITRIIQVFGLALAVVLAPFRLTPAYAQDSTACTNTPSSMQAGDHEMITVSSTALGFTAAKLNPSSGAAKPVCAIVQVISNSVSYWGAFAVPTASDGMVIPTNGSVTVGAANLVSFRMIRVTSDASVAVQYLIPIQ